MTAAAFVAGAAVPIAEVDAREQALRATRLASALPRPGTSEGRQLRRWLTQLLVTERVIAVEAAARGVTADNAPTEQALVPDATARLEIGSVAAAALADPLARALFAAITADTHIADDEVAAYHARNPLRFAPRRRWTAGPVEAPSLPEVRSVIAEHLRSAARRREFRRWLDERCAALVELAPGYEHPGDPSQPDYTHRH